MFARPTVNRFQSYAELLASGRRALGALQAIDGLTAGQSLVLQIADRQVHFAIFWGCLLGGIIPVTIAIPPRHEASNAVVLKLLSTIAQLDARNVLASTANVAALRALLPTTACVLDVHALEWSRADELGDAIAEAAITPEHVAFYQLTSGSTGTPKVIPERHGAIISHIRHSAVHCGYTRSDVTLNWLPFDHVVPMLTCHLADIYLGRHAVQIPTHQLIADPLLWMRTIAEHRVTHSWSPNFGFKLVAQAIERAGSAWTPLDLTTVKHLMNAGEQVTAEVCDAFLRATGLPARVMQPAFGMAEVCTCMTYCNDYEHGALLKVQKGSLQEAILRFADASTPANQITTFMNLGPVSPGVEMRIAANGGTHVLRERQIGHL